MGKMPAQVLKFATQNAYYQIIYLSARAPYMYFDVLMGISVNSFYTGCFWRYGCYGWLLAC